LPTIADAGARETFAADLQRVAQTCSPCSSSSEPHPRPETGLTLDPSSPQDTCFSALLALVGAEDITCVNHAEPHIVDFNWTIRQEALKELQDPQSKKTYFDAVMVRSFPVSPLHLAYC